MATPTGWLAALDPRARLLGAAGFALAVVALQHLATAVVACALALALPLLAGLPGRLLRRGLPLALLMLLLLLTLPFTVPADAGPALAVGPLTASLAGLLLALRMCLQAGAVLLVLLSLVGTLEPAVLGHALARLGAPARLVDLLLLTLRQVHLLGEEYHRLRLAMRVRGFTPRADRHTLHSLGWLIGMLLVRALGRSERVLAAMRLRGWQGRVHLLDELHWRAQDSLLLAGLLVLSLTLVGLDRLVVPGCQDSAQAAREYPRAIRGGGCNHARAGGCEPAMANAMGHPEPRQGRQGPFTAEGLTPAPATGTAGTTATRQVSVAGMVEVCDRWPRWALSSTAPLQPVMTTRTTVR